MKWFHLSASAIAIAIAIAILIPPAPAAVLRFDLLLEKLSGTGEVQTISYLLEIEEWAGPLDNTQTSWRYPILSGRADYQGDQVNLTSTALVDSEFVVDRSVDPTQLSITFNFPYPFSEFDGEPVSTNEIRGGVDYFTEGLFVIPFEGSSNDLRYLNEQLRVEDRGDYVIFGPELGSSEESVFGRLENVAIPEPSTLFLGLVSVGILGLRRR